MVIEPITIKNRNKAGLLLSKAESAYFDELPKNRKNEWLAGRIAAKKVIQKYFTETGKNIKPKQIEIRKTKLGRPYFKNHKVSISHTGKLAAAEISKNPIGIDIQKIRKFPKIVIDNFLTPSEKKFISSISKTLDKKIYQTLIWSIKESYLKAKGVGLRIHPHNIEVKFGNKTAIIYKGKLDKNSNLRYNIDSRRNIIWTEVIIRNKQ